MKFWFKSGAWASKAARRKIARLAPAAVRRIAVIRPAALGDMVLTRPFLLELRRHFPQASITLSVVTNYMRGLPTDLVDRVHVVYGSDRKDVPIREQIARGRELGEHDLLFDLAASTRSFWICALNRAYLKIGFPYHALQRPIFYDVAVLRSDFRTETDSMLDMLNLLGLRTEYPPRFDLPGNPVGRERPYVVYFPGASTLSKCWPSDRFTELLERMAQRYPQYDHLVLEGRAEWESAATMLAPLAGLKNVTALNGAGLEETIALLKGARLLVSNDTGIRNLAIATDTPTVGIFFATSPFLYWPRLPIHEAAFQADGEPPTVEAVYDAARTVMAASS